TLKDMSFALDYVSAFDNLAEIFDVVANQDIPGTDETFTPEYYNKIVAPTLGAISEIKVKYRNYAINSVSEKLITYNRDSTLTKDDIQSLLVSATNDINYLSYFMDAMAES